MNTFSQDAQELLVSFSEQFTQVQPGKKEKFFILIFSCYYHADAWNA